MGYIDPICESRVLERINVELLLARIFSKAHKTHAPLIDIFSTSACDVTSYTDLLRRQYTGFVARVRSESAQLCAAVGLQISHVYDGPCAQLSAIERDLMQMCAAVHGTGSVPDHLTTRGIPRHCGGSASAEYTGLKEHIMNQNFNTEMKYPDLFGTVKKINAESGRSIRSIRSPVRQSRNTAAFLKLRSIAVPAAGVS